MAADALEDHRVEGAQGNEGVGPRVVHVEQPRHVRGRLGAAHRMWRADVLPDVHVVVERDDFHPGLHVLADQVVVLVGPVLLEHNHVQIQRFDLRHLVQLPAELGQHNSLNVWRDLEVVFVFIAGDEHHLVAVSSELLADDLAHAGNASIVELVHHEADLELVLSGELLDISLC